MNKAQREQIYEMFNWLAFMLVDLSQKVDAADVVLQHDPTLQKLYLDTLEKTKHRAQHTNTAARLRVLHKMLDLNPQPLDSE